MWLFIGQLFQLLLAPKRGWEDISEAAKHPDDIQRREFFPWIGLVAASELLRLVYDRDLSVLTAVEMAIIVGGSMVASLFIGRLILDLTLPAYAEKMNVQKIHVFTMYVIAFSGLFRVFMNAVPVDMSLFYFLPMITVLVIFKSTTYMGILMDSRMTFLGISIFVLIGIPFVLSEMLMLII